MSTLKPVTALEALAKSLGEETVQDIVGQWLAQRRRSKANPYFAKPAARLRAPWYLEFVRQLPCASCNAPGPSEPDHFGPRGMARKTDDYRVLPLCRECHEHRHRASWMKLGFQSSEAWESFAKGVMVDTLCRYLASVEQADE